MDKALSVAVREIERGLQRIAVTKVCGDASSFGNAGRFAVFPRNEQEVCDILAFAAENRLTVIPEGAGTKKGCGGTMEMADIVLSMRHIRGIVEHSAGDMILSVKAGTTLADIQRTLAESGQFLPLDAANEDEATIGGIIAANVSGPKRLRYGSARDLVTGLRVVHANGRAMRSGAKVVKNVAGYDMNKLYIGSMGTLGVITELHLKCRPIPECESVMLLGNGAGIEPLDKFSRHLLDSKMEPVALEIVNPALSRKLGGDEAFRLVVSFEDTATSVEQQEQWVYQHAKSLRVCESEKDMQAETWWKRFNQTDRRLVTLKVGSLLTDVPAVLQHAEELAEQLGTSILSHGSVGVGISKIHLRKEDESRALAFIRKMRTLMGQREGYVVVENAPLSLRKQVNVWGEELPYHKLFAGIKQKFDPDNLLNPGRFVVR